jgi:hypothetical protein
VNDVTCSECGITFGLPDHYYDSRRREHDTFYCPNGHNQHFPSKTAEEKRIEELERDWRNTSRVLRQRDEENTDLKHELRRCPVCEEIVTRAQYVDTIRPKMAEHLRDEHGARPRLRAITEKAGEAS